MAAQRFCTTQCQLISSNNTCRSINLFAGGACNFKNNHKAPFNSMTSCGNQLIFKDGAGCGACYQVMLPKMSSQTDVDQCNM
jgi:hypothetical protein